MLRTKIRYRQTFYGLLLIRGLTGIALAQNATQQSDGLEPLLPRLKQSIGTPEWEDAVATVGKHRGKAAVSALISTLAGVPNEPRYVKHITKALKEYARGTESELGAIPDDYLDEWQDWWQRAEPLMTDDLRLVDKIVVEHSAKDFGKRAEDLQLHLAIDSKTYRLKDPIRIDLALRNSSDKPYRVMLPYLADGPSKPFILLNLIRDNMPFFETDPNTLHNWSGPDPTRIEVVEPNRELHASSCLQYILRHQQLPLPEGDYQLQLKYFPANDHSEPSKTEILGPWISNRVTFSIKGEARTDPKEVVDLIAEKSRLKFLRRDLTSPGDERWRWASGAIHIYGDKRIFGDDTLDLRRVDSQYLRE